MMVIARHGRIDPELVQPREGWKRKSR